MNWPSRRAKIVATLGPASSEAATIENLIRAGVNVFRLNFSHGKKEDHRAAFDIIRAASQKLGRAVAILQDLQGPKLRVGSFAGGSLPLEKGEEVVLVLEGAGTAPAKASPKRKLIPCNYEKLSREILPRHRILLDDGNLELVVTGIDDSDIRAQVVFGGILKDKKGMNFPDTKISIEGFTPKDREDLLFGLELGVDFVAISFVRSAADVREVQRFMHKHKTNIPVIAKIEKSEAVANLQEILDVTDGVMVARGDLAVEVGTAPVPSLQKQIIRECNLRGIPVITATQMLESMIGSPRPTRAEASDVANAVLDGTDALMLSAESASGKFPVLAVSVMHNIILETELRRESALGARTLESFAAPGGPAHGESEGAAPVSIVEAIEHAAANLADWVGAKAIACTTHTGRAARALARYRPRVPVVAFTDEPGVQRQLALVWGIETCSMEASATLDAMVALAEHVLVERKIVTQGDLIVFTAGWPPLKYGTTNFLKVLTIQKEADARAKIKARAGGKWKIGAAPFPGDAASDALLGYRTLRAQFVIDQNLCIQCGGCVEVCPNDIFGMADRRVYLKESNCKNCTFDDACMGICPTNAIEIIRLDD
ncbi:MAG: pyruvate kinase [Deltaproteobacteria bacterium]|nr:pyruvate kinase [Deltaproteobacteria bacterium]